MKMNPHVFGVDDAPFEHGQGRVGVVGVLAKAPMYVEKVASTSVDVDGTDGTDALVGLAGPEIRATAIAMMVDGICVGGFNVLDIERIHRETGLPVVTVSVKEPDIGSMADALRKHFDDWERRLELIRKVPLFQVSHGDYRLHCSAAGMGRDDVRLLVDRTVVQGAVPEPVRLAHVIAGGTMDARPSDRGF